MENNQFCLSVQISSERSSSLFPGILCKNAFDLSNQIFYTKTSLFHRVVLILDGHAMITLISKQEAWYQYQSIDGLYRPATNRQAITYSPTHRPTDHRPTDPIITDPTNNILFQRLDQWRIFILQNANSWEDVKLNFGLLSIWWIDIFIKSLFISRKSFSLVFFKRKLLLSKRHTKDLIMFVFLYFKPNCFTPSQIFTVYF